MTINQRSVIANRLRSPPEQRSFLTTLLKARRRTGPSWGKPSQGHRSSFATGHEIEIPKFSKALGLATSMLRDRALPVLAGLVLSLGQGYGDTAQAQTGASAISAGSSHTCALTTRGGVQCWGENYFGQLGNGANTDSNVPVNVSGLSSGVSAVSAGQNYTCALTTGGGVVCWGSNEDGTLGNGTNIDSNVPVNVFGLSSGVSTISAGSLHTCALTTSGGVLCWGDNYVGELGTGDNIDSNVPVNVSGLSSGVRAISAGYHTCALTKGGGVLCWGSNFFGSLGTGDNIDSNLPVNVSGLSSGVSAISAGNLHTCALTTGGGVLCWGVNSRGGLGNGDNTHRNEPVDVSGLSSGIRAVSAGARHTCAMTTMGGVLCWGLNFSGQLGNGNNTDSNVPLNVSGLSSGVSAISAGGDHTCALRKIVYRQCSGGTCSLRTGKFKRCWGSNVYGQLGNGNNNNRNLP